MSININLQVHYHSHCSDADVLCRVTMQADNPGLWYYHCHIVWHQLMGQSLVFAEGVGQIGAPPAELAQCSQQCNYDFGPFDPEWVATNYGNTTYDLPGVTSAVAA